MATEITDDDLNEEDLPPPDCRDLSVIHDFALSFNGYDYWGSYKKCAKVATNVWETWENKKELPPTLTLAELRTALFFEQRLAHWDWGWRFPTAFSFAVIEAIRSKIRERASSAPSLFETGRALLTTNATSQLHGGDRRMGEKSSRSLPRYGHELRTAVRAARAAGLILRDEFNRQPDGPRVAGGHCPADDDAETAIREILHQAFPDYGIRGEEGEDLPAGDSGQHYWLIDPNDGTSAFGRGWRGAAVSIALLRAGVPVLGVVYAYAANAGKGDLVAWAEGHPLRRNGRLVKTDQRITRPESATVLVSQDADRNPAANIVLCAPARFRAVPSIAYRLALVAAGEGIAAVSLNGPADWDVAAGHALLRAVGYELYRMGGEPVVYSRDGIGRAGNCVGGEKKFARDLALRDWDKVYEVPEASSGRFTLVFPDPKQIVPDAGVLSRAQGCMVGQLAGDNLGSLVEFQTAPDIARRYPDGPRELEDGGHWDLLAGQPTDDSEMALMLARSIIKGNRYTPGAAAEAYAWWFGTKPFDTGYTTRNALSPALAALRSGRNALEAATEAAAHTLESQANGAMMRIAPLAIHGYAWDDDTLAHWARRDAAITHASPVCQDASAVFCVAVAAAIRGQWNRKRIYGHVVEWACDRNVHQRVLHALQEAQNGPPEDFQTCSGWVLIALQNAFYEFLHAPDPVEGIVRTVCRGGDTDTNAAIAGALLGAAFGVESFPWQWLDRILSCRPMPETPDCRRPRNKAFWPVDCLILAERLVWLGSRPDSAQIAG